MKELLLLKERIGKRQMIPCNNQTVDDLDSENSVLQKIFSQSNIYGKYLNIFVRNSRKSHDKTDIGYMEQFSKEKKTHHINPLHVHRLMVSLKQNHREKLTTKDLDL